MGKQNKYHKKIIVLPALGIAALSSAVVLGAAPATYAATTGQTNVNVTIGSVLSITVPQQINIAIEAPTPEGTFATGSGQVSVVTNSATGFKSYLTSNDSAGSTTLNHSTTSAKINTISANQTISTSITKFSTANTWAWSNNYNSSTGGNFYPVAAYGTANNNNTVFSQSTQATTGQTTNLTIGVTANSSLTAGTYTGVVLLTAVANS